MLGAEAIERMAMTWVMWMKPWNRMVRHPQREEWKQRTCQEATAQEVGMEVAESLVPNYRGEDQELIATRPVWKTKRDVGPQIVLSWIIYSL